jgi:hypothetical protein
MNICRTLFFGKEMSKNQVLNVELMSEEELDSTFCQIVLKEETNKYSVANGSKEGWEILRKQLKNCYQLVTTKIQIQSEDTLQEKFFVAFVLAGNDSPSIASGSTQAQATVKALILAHNGQYMTGQQLKELRLAIKKRNGKPLTQAEFGAKTGNHTQQSQYDFETGKRRVPGPLATEAFQLFQKISVSNSLR